MNDTQRREAYLQARSYAERLRADVFILCATEGVWTFGREKGRFDAERFSFRTWAGLDDVTSFRGLEDAIGKRSSLWKKGREHDAGG